jgi:predicted permease
MVQSLLPDSMRMANAGPWLFLFGRLKPGVSVADASNELSRNKAETPHFESERHDPRMVAASLATGINMLRVRFEKPLLVLLGIVGLLLLIACVNLAAMLMARAAARRHEIAVRLSLGASRWRLLRQFSTESLVLGLLGGIGGLFVASWGASILVSVVTGAWPWRLPLEFELDARILGFTLALSMLAVMLFGLFPALEANRTRIIHSSTPERSHSSLPGGRPLIIGQMALSLVLLMTAGLLIQSVRNLRSLDTGFLRQNVLTMRLDPGETYGNAKNTYPTLYRDISAQIEALPGVRSASASTGSFMGHEFMKSPIVFEGETTTKRDLAGIDEDMPFQVSIGPRFAEALGIPLAAGRMFTERDTPRARVALISESVAKRHLPGVNPVGKRFSTAGEFRASDSIEVIGVLRDIRFGNLRQKPQEVIYVPADPSTGKSFEIVVRTVGDPTLMIASVQEAVRRFDPGLSVIRAVPIELVFEAWIAEDRLLALLAGFFGSLALILAAIGLYGSTSYGVQRRTSEIGVRMALGASKKDVQWMILREVLVLVFAGAAIGLPIAIAGSEVLSGMLFGLTPTDPVTIAGAVVALILIALVAGYLPARRACQVDPMQALRCE